MNNIVLCGFMGCGKSSVGRIVAARLGTQFIDTDEYIEQREKKSISDIFAQSGETAFRDIEHEVCKELADNCGTVIATGGGALTFDRNRRAFGSDTIIFMSVGFDEIKQRIGSGNSRPLFRDTETARALFNTREPLYRAAADMTVDAGGSPAQAAQRILRAIGKTEGTK